MYKYKPWKLIILMPIIFVLSIFGMILFYKDNNSIYILFLILNVVFLLGIILSFIYFVELYDDKIVCRQGYYVTKKGDNPYKRKESWISPFIITTIYFSDILEVKGGPEYLLWYIYFNNGEVMVISFGGYSKKAQQQILNYMSNRI